eukprot:CAMPEP_0181055144 /NCGR_PEP_ID=MMETSP1070-20121207/19051_1 /TAXON_ID=265543 /ORGANISM="Minutocellus polymorphus, Strain NH13" /LENGTH=317 /DNA_ID=CAMNT_0023134453 /DNA_START=112 /DNA_END=1065 /DNA_ORIENTATION=+
MAPTHKKRKADGEEGNTGRGGDEQGSGSGSGSGSESGPPRNGGIECEHKRQKKAIDAIVKEYSCPLSLELPVEPVTAEDGRVYNRADISRHIENAKNGDNDDGGNDDDDDDDDDGNGDEYKNLRSPVTNEKMGPKLVPAIQVQNMIRALVESKAVDDASIEHWRKVDTVRNKAINGDPVSMAILSGWFFDGDNGLFEDYEMSYSWVKKAADLENSRAKADVGYMLYNGNGVERNPTEAALYLGMAAAMGAPNGAYYLARFYFEGRDDVGCFAKDNGKARYWLIKALGNFGDDAKGQKLAEDLKKLLDKEENNNENDS